MSEYLKIMPDYECFPLWKIGIGIVENVNPEELHISEELKILLKRWQDKYDSTLNKSDPINSGFVDKKSESDFDSEGLAIWKRMTLELGEKCLVKYYSIIGNRLYDSIADLSKEDGHS